MVVLPRWSGVHTAVAISPSGTAAMKLVLLSIVLVPCPSGRFWTVASPPSVSASAMTAPPCMTAGTVHSSGRTFRRATTRSGATSTTSMPRNSEKGMLVWSDIRPLPRHRAEFASALAARQASGLAGLELIEDVAADHVHLLEALRPARADIVGVVMRRRADIGEIGFALEHLLRDARGRAPGIGVGDAQRLALAGEGELAGEMPVPVLVDDAADRGRVEAALHPVQHHLGDRGLPFLGLAAGLEIDRLGEAALLAAEIVRVDQLG